MNLNPNFLILLTIFLFFRCSSNSQSINRISYNSYGGEQGAYTKVELTKDSINGTIESPNEKIIIKEKIQQALWDSLTKSMTLNDFKETNSGKSVTYIDGINVLVKIESDADSHSFLNGDIDKVKNKKVFHFMGILENELRNIYLRVNQK
jgi:hypothetical protein